MVDLLPAHIEIKLVPLNIMQRSVLGMIIPLMFPAGMIRRILTFQPSYSVMDFALCLVFSVHFVLLIDILKAGGNI